MSEKYDEYLKEHKENVLKGFEWLKTNLPEVLPSDMLELSVLENVRMPEHDKSKYDVDEYVPYDAYFYGNRSFGVVEEFNYAWLRHIHNNPHHWQYWVLINDDPDKGEIILEMPHIYIIEMICDWWSFSWKQDKLDEIFKWYGEHKDYIKLGENTRKIVERILSDMQDKILGTVDDANAEN